MNYEPKPIDTSNVELNEEILELQEKLAKNIHENWAKLRMQQGWVYGPERDDTQKKHPNLVPYEQLTEEEKDYDRKTALETLKTIISFGYTISKE